jgi:protein O-GlcNAc transferase
MLGNAAGELGDLDAAAVHFLRARDLQPDEYVIRFNLGLNQLARGYVAAGLEELRVACSLNPDYLPAHSAYILALHNCERVGQDEIAAISREWGARFARQHPAVAAAPPHAETDFPETLRVGFVSGDFRVHSVMHFFEPIVSAHDRSAFEYVLYSNSNHRDEVSDRLRSYCDHWRDVWHVSDDTLIELIRGDRIDILVGLAGHTAFNRLAVRAVPRRYRSLTWATRIPPACQRWTTALPMLSLILSHSLTAGMSNACCACPARNGAFVPMDPSRCAVRRRH